MCFVCGFVCGGVRVQSVCFVSGTVCGAANKLNKQSRTADEGWSSSLWVGRGANKPSL